MVAAGSARCPWTITVDERQSIRVVLYTFGERQPVSASAVSECTVSAVFDGRVEKSLCPLRTHAVRQRLLHSTDSNELTIEFKTTHDRLSRQIYLLHYEGSSVKVLFYTFWCGWNNTPCFKNCSSFLLHSLSSRKCVINSVFSVQCMFLT